MKKSIHEILLANVYIVLYCHLVVKVGNTLIERDFPLFPLYSSLCHRNWSHNVLLRIKSFIAIFR